MAKNAKKAISPVVATALLLVVAVVAVVGFQTWFATFQSGQQAKVEQQSNDGSSITIELLERSSSSNATVYVKNIATSALNMTDVQVTSLGSVLCDLNGTSLNATASSVTTSVLNCTSTLTSGNSYDVVVVTNTGVYSETEIAK